jgi:hypothetical protein
MMPQQLEHGSSYYTLDTGLGWLLQRATAEAAGGRRVMLITRRPRRWVERAHDTSGVDTVHFRIDKTPTAPDTLHPENIGRIFTAVRDYLDRNKGAIVLVDGADMLAFYNGFPMFIKLLYTINDIVWSSGGTVVFLIDPRTFHRRELHIIQKELVELRNPDSKVTVEDAADA